MRRESLKVLCRHVAADSNGRVVIATRESVEESVNEVGQQITRRNLNVQPTLTVRPGFRFRVIVNRDLVLRSLESGEGALR